MNFKLKFQKYTKEQKDLWEKINLESPHSTFLTSIDWIEFQKEFGKNTDQFIIYLQKENSEDIPIGLIYIELYQRKLVNYANSPYGPVINWKTLSEELNIKFNESDKPDGINKELIKEVFKQVKIFLDNYTKQNNKSLFRIEPLLDLNYKEDLLNEGFKESLAPGQAKDFWIKDLTKSEDEMRSEMSKSTRYNINKGGRSDIEIIKADSEKDVKGFSELMLKTTERKDFSNYGYSYFEKQFEMLHEKGMTDIFLARHKGKFIAGALMNYYKDTVSYTHGCSTSDRKLRKLRSPYFNLWNAMLDGKERGFEKFNFWGVLPDKVENHPMKGVSDFKKSFGGYEVNYVGSVETYTNPLKYAVHRLYDWKTYKEDRY